MLDTLANVKTRLGITDAAYDTFLSQQIQLVSDVIEAYLRRKIIEADYVQRFYGTDYRAARMLELYHYPVSAVASIEQDGITLDDSSYRLHTPTGRVINTEGYFFTPKETAVTYTAGYATCPTPILAVLDSVIAERYNKRKSGIDLDFGNSVQRLSIPGVMSIDFDYTLNSNERGSAYGIILGSNANILDDWRSERTILGSGNLEYVEEEA